MNEIEWANEPTKDDKKVTPTVKKETDQHINEPERMFEKTPPVFEKEGYQLPVKLQKQYTVIDGKFFDKNHPEKVHFEDKGKILVTDREDQAIIAAMIMVAKAKGWSEISIKGSEVFRRIALIEAEKQDMQVTGHEPELVKKELKPAEKQANEILYEASKNDASLERIRDVQKLPKKERERTLEFTGILLEHGHAPYNFDRQETVSYFVKYRLDNQREKIQWGTDLERAITESQIKIGQRIELENLGKQRVTVQSPVRDKEGNVVGYEPIETHRNEWKIKTFEQHQHSKELSLKKEPEIAREIKQEDIAIIAARKILMDAIKNISPEKQTDALNKFEASIKSYADKGLKPPLPEPTIRTKEQIIIKSPTQNMDKER